MRPPKLSVTPFRNASGSTSWRLSGTIQGSRVRENFPTQAEAEAAKATRLEGLVVSIQERPVMTRLSEVQVRQAEAAFSDLPAGTSLGQAVRFYRDNFRQLAGATITAATEAYADWLKIQRKNKPATADAIRDFVRHYARSAGISGTLEMSATTARAWIYAPGSADRTQRDRYDRLNGFCAWAVKQRMLARNFVAEDLDRPVVKNEAPPGILSFEQARLLLQCALTDPEGPDMLPFFSACVLSGVRPDEVPRLSWDDVQLEEEHPYLELNYAKGGRRRRHVVLCDSLVRIFTWCKARELALGFFSKRKFNRIRRAAGVFDLWEKDLLRHTYASWHYALHREIGDLVATMGNSEDVLFQHYVRPMAKREAGLFPGLCLNWQAAPRQSTVGVRIDRLMVHPVAEIPRERLDHLRTHLAGEVARLDRRTKKLPPAEAGRLRPERDRLAARLVEVVAAMG